MNGEETKRIPFRERFPYVAENAPVRFGIYLRFLPVVIFLLILAIIPIAVIFSFFVLHLIFG